MRTNTDVSAIIQHCLTIEPHDPHMFVSYHRGTFDTMIKCPGH